MKPTVMTVWHPNDPVLVPANANDAGEIAPLAQQLRPNDVDKIVRAFQAGLYEFAIEYVWKRTMSILKKQLSMMGMSFVGEMLARPDIDEDSPIELVVTDYEAISLAHQLGIINRIGAIELRQSAELLSYYSSSDLDDNEELPYLQALNLLRSCVTHILARNKIDAALDFSEFRKTLTQRVVSENDPSLIALRAAAYFFKRTTIRVLLADAKTERGAQAENALGNLNVCLPILWPDLQDPDRWQVGQTYAETSANNQKGISSTLRRTLMVVQGFDYVPETLRSGTYTKLANEVLLAHEQMNNFYNEPAPMKALATLGSTIPGPAFQMCMRATLAVKLGNKYGISFDAQEHADKLLSSLSPDRWNVYVSKFLPSDEFLLGKLTEEKPTTQFQKLVDDYNLASLQIQNSDTLKLVQFAAAGKVNSIHNLVRNILSDISP